MLKHLIILDVLPQQMELPTCRGIVHVSVFLRTRFKSFLMVSKFILSLGKCLVGEVTNPRMIADGHLNRGHLRNGLKFFFSYWTISHLDDEKSV